MQNNTTVTEVKGVFSEEKTALLFFQIESPKLNSFSSKGSDPGGGGEGVLPYISYIGMCRPKGYGF